MRAWGCGGAGCGGGAAAAEDPRAQDGEILMESTCKEHNVPRQRTGWLHCARKPAGHLGVPGEARGHRLQGADTHKTLGKSPLNSALNFLLCAKGMMLGPGPALGPWREWNRGAVQGGGTESLLCCLWLNLDAQLQLPQTQTEATLVAASIPQTRPTEDLTAIGAS